MKPVIFLMGPTASGKTTAAVELVRALPLEVISVDSAMVYRGMDIGTAKPPEDVLREVPHRLIDIRDPAERYSAGDFVRDARAEIDAIHAGGRIPLLVGGTGLYFRSLQQGISRLPEADPVIRARLEEEMRARGLPVLYRRLADIDPDSAGRIHPNDPQRIQRALEIYEISGTQPSSLYAEGRIAGLSSPVIKIILAPGDRQALHAAIKSRFLGMVEAGLVAEVERLRARGDLDGRMPSMRLVGYRQVWSYLDGSIDYNDMINKGIAATRQLARRQLTWLRSEQEALWVDSHQPRLSQFLLNFLNAGPLTAA